VVGNDDDADEFRRKETAFSPRKVTVVGSSDCGQHWREIIGMLGTALSRRDCWCPGRMALLSHRAVAEKKFAMLGLEFPKINQSIDKEVDQSTKQNNLINQSINQSIKRSIESSINQVINQSINQAIHILPVIGLVRGE
jgi:hypothetical protein